MAMPQTVENTVHITGIFMKKRILFFFENRICLPGNAKLSLKFFHNLVVKKSFLAGKILLNTQD